MMAVVRVLQRPNAHRAATTLQRMGSRCKIELPRISAVADAAVKLPTEEMFGPSAYGMAYTAQAQPHVTSTQSPQKSDVRWVAKAR